ncbi:MAG TPA: fumarylacetoacetate hydrolase family protein [Candidatus Limnocylindrales bacterium]|nr:fumarylacetoacetate hydrolase family protein [Candidatus Limnocylindrales bacterium]
MKLVAYTRADGTRETGRAGMVVDGSIVPLEGTGADVGPLIGSAVPQPADESPVDPGEVRLLAPLPNPGKIICVGLNYHDHCREQHIEPPAYPMLFAKFANAVSNPGDPVVRPRATEKLDLECELALVIGRRASRIGREEAMDAVFGFTILNDVTMRDLQREDRQWLRAKGSDGFAPIGPAIVTVDELADWRAIRLRSAVNGATWQESSTAEMVFDLPTLVAFASRTITLLPGDIIATGTPAGVGHYQDPPRYLKGGDVMRCEIEGIGVLENPVVDEEPRTDDHVAAAGIAELGRLRS